MLWFLTRPILNCVSQGKRSTSKSSSRSRPRSRSRSRSRKVLKSPPSAERKTRSPARTKTASPARSKADTPTRGKPQSPARRGRSVERAVTPTRRSARLENKVCTGGGPYYTQINLLHMSQGYISNNLIRVLCSFRLDNDENLTYFHN